MVPCGASQHQRPQGHCRCAAAAFAYTDSTHKGSGPLRVCPHTHAILRQLVFPLHRFKRISTSSPPKLRSLPVDDGLRLVDASLIHSECSCMHPGQGPVEACGCPSSALFRCLYLVEITAKRYKSSNPASSSRDAELNSALIGKTSLAGHKIQGCPLRISTCNIVSESDATVRDTRHVKQQSSLHSTHASYLFHEMSACFAALWSLSWGCQRALLSR